MAKKTERRNRRAVIQTRYTENGKLRTETANRDDDISVAASTIPRDNSTRVYIDTPNGTVVMDGRMARTLYRVLTQHYAYKEVNGCGRPPVNEEDWSY
jgi:hypothetical protein